ncbi:MAG: fibronectin type III domain-containing protein [Steroidobacteraceae bacterium]
MKPAKLLLIVPVALVAVGPSHSRDARHIPKPEPLDVDMFYQYSATDDDAEVTIDIESADNPIDFLVIVAPNGRTVASVQSKDRIGLAEVEIESAEPSVEQVQEAYPQGKYSLLGRSVNGRPLLARVDMTHAVVGAPDFFNASPCNEEDVDPASAVTIAWNSVEGAAGGYEIIIEQDDTGANMRTTQSPAATSFVIPSGFLEAGLEYEIEMKAVTAGGNKTSASCEFSTQ